MEEQEIDLRQHLHSLIRYWYLPVVCLALGILLSVVLVAWRPHVYQGRVLVAAMTMPNQGATDEALGTFLNQFFTSSTERKQHMAALQSLVVNPAVAQVVVERMGAALPENLRRPDVLMRSVSSRLVSGTDIIAVSAVHADPQLALQLADAWAEAYISVVGDVYGDVPLQQRQALAQQRQQARERYDRTEAAWEDALLRDRFDSLSRALASRQALLQTLSDTSDSAWVQLAGEVARTERLLSDVRALQEQMRAGGHPEANAPALLVLKMRALASLWGVEHVTSQPFAHPADKGLPTTNTMSDSAMAPESAPGVSVSPGIASTEPTLPLQLQSTIPEMTAQEISTELQLLDESLQSRLVSLKEAWDATTRSLAGGSGDQPLVADPSALAVGLEEQIRDLRVQRAQEESRLRLVQSERDLAWQTYQDLATQEIRLAQVLANQQQGLRVAAPARLYDPSASSRTDRLLSAGIAGLILGVVVALVLGWLRRSPAS